MFKKKEVTKVNCDVENTHPIGTVVELKKFDRKVMICGIKQHVQETNEDFDYVGVLYPEGFIGIDYFYNFNHADIKAVVFTGYHNNERTSLLQKIKKHYENKGRNEQSVCR